MVGESYRLISLTADPAKVSSLPFKVRIRAKYDNIVISEVPLRRTVQQQPGLPNEQFDKIPGWQEDILWVRH